MSTIISNRESHQISQNALFFVQEFGQTQTQPINEGTRTRTEWLQLGRGRFLYATFNSLISLAASIAKIAFYSFMCVATGFSNVGFKQQFREQKSETFSLISSTIIGFGGCLAPDRINRYLGLPLVSIVDND